MNFSKTRLKLLIPPYCLPFVSELSKKARPDTGTIFVCTISQIVGYGTLSTELFTECHHHNIKEECLLYVRDVGEIFLGRVRLKMLKWVVVAPSDALRQYNIDSTTSDRSSVHCILRLGRCHVL